MNTIKTTSVSQLHQKRSIKCLHRNQIEDYLDPILMPKKSAWLWTNRRVQKAISWSQSVASSDHAPTTGMITWRIPDTEQPWKPNGLCWTLQWQGWRFKVALILQLTESKSQTYSHWWCILRHHCVEVLSCSVCTPKEEKCLTQWLPFMYWFQLSLKWAHIPVQSFHWAGNVSRKKKFRQDSLAFWAFVFFVTLQECSKVASGKHFAAVWPSSHIFRAKTNGAWRMTHPLLTLNLG